MLTAAPLNEAISVLERKWHAYFKSSEPWPVKNAKLARITNRQSNDTLPLHKVGHCTVSASTLSLRYHKSLPWRSV